MKYTDEVLDYIDEHADWLDDHASKPWLFLLDCIEDLLSNGKTLGIIAPIYNFLVRMLELPDVIGNINKAALDPEKVAKIGLWDDVDEYKTFGKWVSWGGVNPEMARNCLKDPVDNLDFFIWYYVYYKGPGNIKDLNEFLQYRKRLGV